MIKILIVTTVAETLSTILKDQPSFLSKHYDVSLACSPSDAADDICSYEGVSVYSVPMHRGISPVRDLLSIVRMFFLIRKIRPDAIHSYTPKAGLVAMLSGFLCGVPVRVHTFTGLIFPTQHGVRKNILIWVDRVIAYAATSVVPEGEGVKKQLLTYQITNKPLSVIGNGNIAGVDTSYFSLKSNGVMEQSKALKKSLNIDDESFVFCYVGRLNCDKGIPELISAFLEMPAQALLLLVGDLDSTAPIDMNTQKVINDNPRIYRLGFVEDVRPVMIVSDVLVLASYREGFPNVILQAGSMQLPVIATDVNGCNEVIEPKFNGWIVPTRNSQELNCAMIESMNEEKGLLASYGRNARIKVKKKFERDMYWEYLLEFYNCELSLMKT